MAAFSNQSVSTAPHYSPAVKVSLSFVAVAAACLVFADVSIITLDPWSEMNRMARGAVTPDFAAVIGMAQGLSLGTMATSTYDVIPENGRGRLQALRRTLSEVGGVSGPMMGGLVATAYYPGAPFLVVGPMLILTALLIAVVAKETLVKQRRTVTA